MSTGDIWRLAFVLTGFAVVLSAASVGVAIRKHAQADPVPIYVEGDFDFDEDVDLKDFALFQRNFTCEYGGGPG